MAPQVLGWLAKRVRGDRRAAEPEDDFDLLPEWGGPSEAEARSDYLRSLEARRRASMLAMMFGRRFGL